MRLERPGFGVVKRPNKKEAEKAISGLNGKDPKGKTLTVNEARPRTDKPRTGGGKGGCLKRGVRPFYSWGDFRPPVWRITEGVAISR